MDKNIKRCIQKYYVMAQNDRYFFFSIFIFYTLSFDSGKNIQNFSSKYYSILLISNISFFCNFNIFHSCTIAPIQFINWKAYCK